MRIQVALIILYDSGERFLLQHRTHDAALLPNHWAFFGGRLETGETPRQALAREAFEELHYTVQSPELVLTHAFCEDDLCGELYVFTEYFGGDKNTLRLQEGQDWGWFSAEETSTLKMTGRDREIVAKLAQIIAQRV
ncbi:MAG: NUDIX domain-containing protein [Candidatus Omnitrophota bacterium]